MSMSVVINIFNHFFFLPLKASNAQENTRAYGFSSVEV